MQNIFAGICRKKQNVFPGFCRKQENVCSVDVQIADEGQFGGLLSGPAALGLYSALYLDEIDVGQVGGLSVPADCVGDAELVDVGIRPAPVVGVAPVEGVAYPKGTVAVLVDEAVFEAGTAQGIAVSRNPEREIGLLTVVCGDIVHGA